MCESPSCFRWQLAFWISHWDYLHSVHARHWARLEIQRWVSSLPWAWQGELYWERTGTWVDWCFLFMGSRWPKAEYMLTLISALGDTEVSKMKMTVKGVFGFHLPSSLVSFALAWGPLIGASHAFLGPTCRVWNPKMGLGLEFFLSFKHPRPMQLVHRPPKETRSVFFNEECDETLVPGR